MKQNKLECQHLRLRSNTPAVFERWEESAGDTFAMSARFISKKAFTCPPFLLKLFNVLNNYTWYHI